MALRITRRLLGFVLLTSLTAFMVQIGMSIGHLPSSPATPIDDSNWLNFLFSFATMLIWFGSMLVGGIKLLSHGEPQRAESVAGLIGFALFWWVVMGRMPSLAPITSIDIFLGFMLSFGTTVSFILDLILPPWPRKAGK